MENILATLAPLQAAVLALRARSGNATFGTQVKTGKFRLVTFTPNGRKAMTATPITDYAPISDLVSAIEAM